MSGFAYAVHDGKAESLPLKRGLEGEAPLRWLHLTTNDERAQAWLGGEAHLPPYIIEALTAEETRPRCDAYGNGAVINLRGLSSAELSAPLPALSAAFSACRSARASTNMSSASACRPTAMPSLCASAWCCRMTA